MRGMLAIGLLVARAASAEAPAAMPRYPGAKVVSIADGRADVEGHPGSPSFRPALLEYFNTNDSPERVLEYFLNAWRKDGLPAVASRVSADEWTAAAFDLRQGAQRMVAVFRQRSGTAAFASLTRLWPQGPRPVAPLHLEEALAVEVAHGEGSFAELMLFRASKADAWAELRARASAQGWQWGTEGMNSAWATARRGEGEWLALRLLEVSAGHTAALQRWGGKGAK